MQYRIAYRQEPLGIISDPQADVSIGVVFGAFTPLPAYEHVRSLFRLFTTSAITGHDEGQLLDYYRKRDALHLTLTTIQGTPVSTLVIHITDLSEELADHPYSAEFIVDYPDGSFFLNPSLWDQ